MWEPRASVAHLANPAVGRSLSNSQWGILCCLLCFLKVGLDLDQERSLGQALPHQSHGRKVREEKTRGKETKRGRCLTQAGAFYNLFLPSNKSTNSNKLGKLHVDMDFVYVCDILQSPFSLRRSKTVNSIEVPPPISGPNNYIASITWFAGWWPQGKSTCHIQRRVHYHWEMEILLRPDFSFDLVTNSGLKWRSDYIKWNSGVWDFIELLNRTGIWGWNEKSGWYYQCKRDV